MFVALDTSNETQWFAKMLRGICSKKKLNQYVIENKHTTGQYFKIYIYLLYLVTLTNTMLVKVGVSTRSIAQVSCDVHPMNP